MIPPRFPTRKLLLFVALGALDFALTRYLLQAGGEAVRESNPVAAWWLGRYGWLGLAAFKATTMALAAGLGVFIFLRRPAVGHRVLGFGCAALAAVVLYSGYLCDQLRRHPSGLDPALVSEAGLLDAGLERAAAHRRTLEEVAGDLCARHCTLEEGVARLAVTEAARDPKWVASLRFYYPGRGDAECLAISLMNHLEQERDAQAVCDDLRAEFRDLYGRPAPAPPAGRLVAGRPRVQ